MSETTPDFDLHELFRREHTHVPEQPFVATLAARVVAERTRARRLRRSVEVAALALVVATSPWLIAGSEWLTARVGVVPEAAAVWLGTPLGMACGAVAVAVLLALRRLKIV